MKSSATRRLYENKRELVNQTRVGLLLIIRMFHSREQIIELLDLGLRNWLIFGGQSKLNIEILL